MKSSKKNRPPLEYMGPYNVSRSEVPDYDGKIWVESDELEELSIAEFFAVRQDVIAALSQHGIVSHAVGDDHDFFVYDDKFFDRTQKVELNLTERLPKILPAAVRSLQDALKDHPLWRVMFIGDDHASETEFFVVYPDVVRIAQLEDAGSVPSAVEANAKLRLGNQQKRDDHQKRRNVELKRAAQSAITGLTKSSDDLLLVSWYDTVSAFDWKWGWEGKAGTSIWIILREPLPDGDEILTSDLAHSRYWAAADGTIVREEPKNPATQMHQIVHFIDDYEVHDQLAFRYKGKSIIGKNRQSRHWIDA